MKCTAVIHHLNNTKTRPFNVPVLPLSGDTITFSSDEFDDSYIVKRIEFVANEEGLTVAINIHCER